MPRVLSAGLALLALILCTVLALRLATYRPIAEVPSMGGASASYMPADAGTLASGRGDFLGVVIPASSVDITPKFEGRLESLSVQVGDRVSAGATLGRLDMGPLRKELAIAQAGLKIAQAQERVAAVALKEAQERVRRNSTPSLISLKALPDEEIATAQFQEQSAAARLSAAQAQVQEQLARVEQSQQRIADAILTAPFEAVVAARYLDPGAFTSPSRPILRLLESGELKVRFAIPEEEVHKVWKGAPVKIRLLQQDTLLEGRVESIAPEVEAASRMVLAMARLEVAPGSSVPAGIVVRILVGLEAQRTEPTATGAPR